MNLWAVIHLLAAASGLVVLPIALTRGATGPLRRPLVLIALDQFAWNAAAVGTALTGAHAFELLGAIAAPLFPPVALHFVLAFVGQRRRQRRLLLAAFLCMGAQGLWPLLELVGLPVGGSLGAYGLLLLAGGLPLGVVGLFFTVRHLREAHTARERLGTQVLLLAVVLLMVLLPTEPLADAGLPVPRLATLGSLSFNALLAWLTVRLLPLQRRPGLDVAFAVLGAITFTVTYLALIAAFSAPVVAFVVAVASLGLTAGVLARLWWTTQRTAQAGLTQLATLGRFSAQMAHDLKNPLAAARGAAEYLAEELRRAEQPAQVEFAGLVVQQLDRLQTVIDRYQKLARLEPQRRDTDVNALVQRVLGLQTFGAQRATVTTELATPAPRALADPDLLASALENLVKNAFDAMPTGGAVTVRTSVHTDRDAPRLELTVSDTGPGFDPRAREQAFELFFTTRAQGSGLGLAFVREVARAHGGDARLAPSTGAGAAVTLWLPLESPSDG